MTSGRDLKAGDLILYPYLWSWRTSSGRIRGDKIRPVIILYRGSDLAGDRDKVLICPITSAEVRKPNLWVDIPEREARSAHIKNIKGSKVIISECNMDEVGKSIHMLKDPHIPGCFSEDFIALLRRRFMDMVRERNMRNIPRRNEIESESPAP
jgi:hypothetical protein